MFSSPFSGRSAEGSFSCRFKSRIALLVSATGVSGLERCAAFGTMAFDPYRFVDSGLLAFVHAISPDSSIFFTAHVASYKVDFNIPLMFSRTISATISANGINEKFIVYEAGLMSITSSRKYEKIQ